MPTLDEAIRRNKVLMDAPILRDDPIAVETFKFNIEALKFIASWNQKQLPQHQIHLPGETEPEPQPTREEVKRYMDEREGEGTNG